jgi:Rho termination factor, N-terminal domain
MPKTTKSGAVKKSELPRTLQKLLAKAQKGPSDSLARSGGPDPQGRSAAGVDANASKKHLAQVARRLDIPGRSTMSKGELVSAIEKANRRATARSR